MLKRKEEFKLSPVDYGASHRPSKTIPDQSMSIQEIVRRFVRGIPVDVVQRPGVFVDQTEGSEHDLEQLSRMDFADKASMAEGLKAQAESTVQQMEAEERMKRAKKAKAAKSAKADSQTGTGIGSLDNTMPVDTKQTTK